MRTPVLLAGVMLLTGFSGCLVEFADKGGQTEPDQIVKRVVLTINPQTMESEPRIEDLVKTTLEYTHRGEDAPASDLAAEYTHASGAMRTRPLSTFSTKPTLRDGDIVTINDANLTSGLVIRQGGAALAERSALHAEWFEADGMPVPLRTDGSGKIQYELKSSSGFDASANDFDADDETHIDEASAHAEASVDGSLALITSDSPGGRRIEGTIEVSPRLEVVASAKITDSEGSYEIGVETQDMQGRFDAKGMLEFGRTSGSLQRTGGSFSGEFDGRVHMWDREHPKSSNYEPEDFEHPIFKESQPYEEQPFEASGDSPEAWMVDFFTRLWSMRVGVGDDYRVHIDFLEEGRGFQFDFILQIVALEPRDVGGDKIMSYRVSETANIIVHQPNSGQTAFDLIHATFWVAEENHIPVYAQTSYTKSFNRDDIKRFLEAFGEDSPFTLPRNVNIAIRGEQTLQMTSYSPSLQFSPIVGVLSSNPIALGGWIPGAGAAGAFGSDIGGSSEEESAPTFSFNVNDSSDRLTIGAATDRADWSRIGVRLESVPDGVTIRLGCCPSPYFNQEASTSGPEVPPDYDLWVSFDSEPMHVGDFLEFCLDQGAVQDVRLRITDIPSNQVMGEFSFMSLASC